MKAEVVSREGAKAQRKFHEADIAVDPIILGEIQFGIFLLPKGRRRQRLEAWFGKVAESIACFSWDVETGMCWARLLARLRSAGESMPVKDSLIAATALQNGSAVVTRNVRDFARAGVKVVNPFA